MRRRRILFVLGLFAAVMLVLLVVDYFVRDRARRDRVYSLNNLRELGMFAQMHAAPGKFELFGAGKEKELDRLRGMTAPVSIFAGTVPNREFPVEKRLSWVVRALPYMNHQRQDIPSLLASINETQGWESKLNVTAKETILKSLLPTNVTVMPGPGEPAPTYYVAMGGIGPGDAATLPIDDPKAGCVGYDRETPFKAIVDGLRETILFAETAHQPSPWIAGGPGTVRTVNDGPPLGLTAPFGGVHRGVTCVAYADGSANALSDRISPEVFRALVTINGGNPLIGE